MLVCSWDYNGQTSFLELLKTALFLEEHAAEWADRVDLSRNYSASGHRWLPWPHSHLALSQRWCLISTGARAVLMLAALRDTPAYLANVCLPLLRAPFSGAAVTIPPMRFARSLVLAQVKEVSSQIWPAMRRALAKIGSVVADHPDMMYLTKYNADVAHYNITYTPTMILTGSADTSIEAPGSGWKDFRLIQARTKAFCDVQGADHSEPVENHRGGPFIAYWSQLFALGNETAAPLIYGSGPGSMQQVLPIAGIGDENTGAGKVGFLACRETASGLLAEPVRFAEYCA